MTSGVSSSRIMEASKKNGGSVENTNAVGYFIPWYRRRQHKMILGMAKPSPTYAGDRVLVHLGAAIRQRRVEVGLSQEALAVDAGLDRSYMGGIERGEHNLSLMNFKKIATALNIKMSALLTSCSL
jgi:DNA-binding XRE family transcriptional regulator